MIFRARVTSIVNQARSPDENSSDQKVVEKVLRSLIPKFVSVVVTPQILYFCENMTSKWPLFELSLHLLVFFSSAKRK